MSEFIKGYFVGCVLVGLATVFVILPSVNDDADQLNHTCAKQHNVYSCHIISVPDEKGK